MLAVSDITRAVDRAFMLIGGVCLLMLVGITAAMVISVVRYRRGRPHATSQVEGHTLLELTWTVIPTLIVTWMFFVGYGGFGIMRRPPEGAMVVRVTGRQWAWSFHYPDAGIDAAEMVVPVNAPVKVELTAPPNDVIHSFYIPDFRVKEDVLPGRTTYLWFQADQEGTYHIFCAEFCGKGHASMLAALRVVSHDEYRAWLERQRAARYQPLIFEAVVNPQHERFGPSGLNIDVPALYRTFCASCHGDQGDGSGLPGSARNFTSAQGWKRGTKVTDVYRTLMTGIEGTQMRAYPNLTPWQRVALAHHVRSFLKPAPPADTRADYDTLVQEYALDRMQAPPQTIPIERAMEILVEESR